MIKPTPEDFVLLMQKNKHHVFEGNYNINIVGYRVRKSRPNYFDDTIAIYYKNSGIWFARFYEATTVPGLPYLYNPLNSSGTAILATGQYESCYKIGLHKGKYQALVQVAPVSVYRDNNRDSVYDTNELTAETGMFGINIHKASALAKVVGTNSAGCQVIKDQNDFDDFMTVCRKASQIWGNSFSYTLVNI